MKFNIEEKIFDDFESFKAILKNWKAGKEVIVFTNGCFDIIHHGHVDSLKKSADFGTKLIVGLNSDKSVEILKGRNRPVFNQHARALMIAAIACVDAVIIFTEETPANLIEQILPDFLVKGKQYEIHEIAGHETVLAHGGRVETLDLVPDISTSEVIRRIKELDE
jgi:D-beta-D-heptose 7-phosphate kinase/D-beta-D-heptose 1-phosphate adenosyltransferase